MDLATILGLIIGTSFVTFAMFLEASSSGISMLKFWSASSIMIVLGGTLAATAVAFRLHEVKRVFMIIKFAFSKPKFQLHELVEAIVGLAEINRKGPSELEKEIPNIKYPFLQDGVTFVTQGMKLDDLREILEQREAFRYKRELHEVHFQAWKKGLKSLYYCRSKSIQRAENINTGSSTDIIKNVYSDDEADNEECLSCQ